MAAIDIKSFMDAMEFKKRLDSIIKIIKSTPLAPNKNNIYIPGEIEFLERENRIKNGIPLNDSLLNDLIGLASDQGINLSKYSFLKTE